MEKKRFKAYKPLKACIMSAMVGMVIGAILGHYVPELDLPDALKVIIALFGYAISGFAGFIILFVEGLISHFEDGDE